MEGRTAKLQSSNAIDEIRTMRYIRPELGILSTGTTHKVREHERVDNHESDFHTILGRKEKRATFATHF